MANWENKSDRAKMAKRHTEEMERKYGDEIARCVRRTVEFTEEKVSGVTLERTREEEPVIVLVPHDSVTAVLNLQMDAGKSAVLNFASYKYPGGGFLQGSRAQEECLCHESFLYNVLDQKKAYYEKNRDKSNRSLYYNRALYTPDVLFLRKERRRACDVITCAAPNWIAAKNYSHVTAEENSAALASRIRFLARICQKFEVKTVILGAYGCGVFGQSPEEVVALFLKDFRNTDVQNIMFAVPSKIDPENYRAFAKALQGQG